LKGYEFLQECMYFRDKTDNSCDTVFRFQDGNFEYRIYIPTTFTKHSKLMYDCFFCKGEQYSFHFGSVPEWFLELFSKAKDVFREKNRIRAIFHAKKTPYELLKEVLTSDEGIETLTRFYDNGYIVTSDSGVYEDAKNALEDEGYPVKTNFDANSRLYEIHVDED